MGRRFFGGFAAGLLILALGVRIESEFPSQVKPIGYEKVGIHGIEVYHKDIHKQDVATHSPIPALATLVAAVLIGSVAWGLLTLLGFWVVERFFPPPATKHDATSPSEAERIR